MVKKEKIVKVLSNSYTPINIDFSPDESFNFMNNKTVAVKTQLGSTHKGKWELSDSVIRIDLVAESKYFKIQTINSSKMILFVDNIRLTLENK